MGTIAMFPRFMARASVHQHQSSSCSPVVVFSFESDGGRSLCPEELTLEYGPLEGILRFLPSALSSKGRGEAGRLEVREPWGALEGAGGRWTLEGTGGGARLLAPAEIPGCMTMFTFINKLGARWMLPLQHAARCPQAGVARHFAKVHSFGGQGQMSVFARCCCCLWAVRPCRLFFRRP